MYAYCNNNPVMLVDPTGREGSAFDDFMVWWGENGDTVIAALVIIIGVGIVIAICAAIFFGVMAVVTYFAVIPLLKAARDWVREYRNSLPEPTTDAEKFLNGVLKFADGLLSALIVVSYIVVVASAVAAVVSAVMAVIGIAMLGVVAIFGGIMDITWLVWDKFRMEITVGSDDDEINFISTQASGLAPQSTTQLSEPKLETQAAASKTTLNLGLFKSTDKNSKINLTVGNKRQLGVYVNPIVSTNTVVTGYKIVGWTSPLIDKGKARVDSNHVLHSIKGTDQGTLTVSVDVTYMNSGTIPATVYTSRETASVRVTLFNKERDANGNPYSFAIDGKTIFRQRPDVNYSTKKLDNLKTGTLYYSRIKR
jgi:hypothetical protein